MVAELWKTTSFRNSIVEKLDQELREAGLDSYQNGAEIEGHVFTEAKTSEEYVNFVSKLIQHIRDVAAPTSVAAAQMESIKLEKKPDQSSQNNQ